MFAPNLTSSKLSTRQFMQIVRTQNHKKLKRVKLIQNYKEGKKKKKKHGEWVNEENLSLSNLDKSWDLGFWSEYRSRLEPLLLFPNRMWSSHPLPSLSASSTTTLRCTDALVGMRFTGENLWNERGGRKEIWKIIGKREKDFFK